MTEPWALTSALVALFNCDHECAIGWGSIVLTQSWIDHINALERNRVCQGVPSIWD